MMGEQALQFGGAIVGEGMLTDEAIRSPEQDYLGFTTYAETLADFIGHPGTRTPLTIGIYGRWGSGKTSLMRLIQHIVEQRGMNTMWFNPWEYFREGGVLSPILKHLGYWSEQGGDTDGADGVASVVAQALAEKGAHLSAFTHSAEWGHYERALARNDYEAYRRVFAELVRQVVGVDGRLVVFIDDLDRCLPQKVVSVLEEIKLILHVPNCVFVLGADRELIEKGIQIIYQHLNISPTLVAETERDYMEKIIQVQFSIPPVNRATMTRFISALSPTDELGSYSGVILDGFRNNPRKVKQFLNEFRLLLTLARRTHMFADEEEEPDNPQLLAKWLVLERRWPDYYRLIVEYPPLLRNLEEAVLTERGTAPPPDVESELLEQCLRDRRLAAFLRNPPHFGETDLMPYIHLARSTAPELSPQETPQDTVRLQESLFSEDAVKREAALDRLRTMDAEEQDPHFDVAIAELHSTEAARRARAIQVLEAIGDSQSLEILYDFVQEPERFAVERSAALSALARCGGAAWAERLAALGLSFIPGGTFAFGSGMTTRMVEVADFYMETTLVTQADYRHFLEATGHRAPATWTRQVPSPGDEDLPVCGVTWNDACAYARWTRRVVPNEFEWERAARGDDRRAYPWGNEFDPALCNSGESEFGKPTRVRELPGGASPYGCLDMAGNLRELVAGKSTHSARATAADTNALPVLCGGGYLDNRIALRTFHRLSYDPMRELELVGFRCCIRCASRE